MCHLICIRLLKNTAVQQSRWLEIIHDLPVGFPINNIISQAGEWVSKTIYEQIEGIRELQSGSVQSKHRKQKWQWRGKSFP